jgi:hypothetical protein
MRFQCHALNTLLSSITMNGVIKHGDKHYGPYESQRAAIKVAVERANKSGLAGEAAQVLIQGEDHLFRTEWT